MRFEGYDDSEARPFQFDKHLTEGGDEHYYDEVGGACLTSLQKRRDEPCSPKSTDNEDEGGHWWTLVDIGQVVDIERRHQQKCMGSPVARPR